MRRHKGLGAAACVLFFAALAFPALALGQDLKDKIRSLEKELADMKKQQELMEAEQMQLKKEATAAAAALPTFSYRPGNGVLIEDAKKAWGLRFTLEANFDMPFEAGDDHAGRTRGEIFGRRFRPFIFFCTRDCFYEIEWGLDNDGWGTGNGKNATATDVGSILQRGVAHIHFEQINPWLPTFNVGMDLSNTISTFRRGSSATGAQLEYDLLSRNNGFNTGRAGNGINLSWNNISLGPGRARFQLSRATHGEGDDGRSSFSDKANYHAWLRVDPFARLKSKWLSGLGFELGAWLCTLDKNPAADNACDRNRVRDHGPGGRQTLFDYNPGNSRGDVQFFTPGIGWTIGPYTLRAIRYFTNYNYEDNGEGIDTKNRNFLIGNDLFIWSPKGFLTGSPTTPGSVLLGFHFERNDYSCGAPGCSAGGFSRNRILLREWDIWYFLANRMNIGLAVLWYDASNLPAAAADNLNVSGNSGDWVDATIRLRLNF